MANKENKTAAVNTVTENTVEAKIAELNSTSKGLELAKKKIQEREDQAAAEDAMQVLGMSNYANLKSLAAVRKKRKEAEALKGFLMKTKSLLEVATKEKGDEKEHDKALFDKLSEKYKDKDMTTRNYREEFDGLNATLRDEMHQIRTEYDTAVRDLRRILENHGVWSFSFSLEF